MRRLMSKTPDASLNEPAISFTYNDLGQRNSMTDASGTTSYLYDSRNRLASRQTPNGNLNYTYDENGSIKTLRSNHTNGVSVDYSYDDLSRLSQVKDNRLTGSQNTTYSYDAVGNLQSYSYPNTVTTSYAYNNLNRLTTLSVANGQTNLASYAYTLGASGNRTSVTEASGRTVNYAYDDLYRLTSETIANSANNGQISYQFDAVGNRLQRNSNVNLVANQTSSYDANDRLNSDVFDNNGSTKISNGKSYNYDFENHLTSTSDGITVVYDGDGNRVSKTVNGLTTKYLVDTNNLTGYAQVVEELQNNLVVKQYTYGLDLISQKQSSGVSFYNYDGHGSVRGLSNNLGNVTDTYAYDAFGTIIEKTGNTDNNYLYAGEQFDADLGFYYNRARYLNVETGRFISQDSYEGNNQSPLSLHKYLYANADGINKTDPSGLTTIIEQNAVVTNINIGSTYSYAPLSTVSNTALAEFSAESALIAGETAVASSTTYTALASILAFATGVTIGTIVAEAGKPKRDDYEVFFRAMSSNEYSKLQSNGGLSVKPNRTELFVTQSFDYVYGFANMQVGFDIIVAFVMESGTKDALLSNGAVSNSARELDPTLSYLPHISSFRKNEPNVVHLKGEKGALTYGLRHGTIGDFNSRIVGFQGFSK
jgi:RHS repeat-associated protein